MASKPINALRQVSVARVSLARRATVTRAALASPIENTQVEIGTYGTSAALDGAIAISGIASPAKFFESIGIVAATATLTNYHYFLCAVALVSAVVASRGVVAAQRGRLTSDTYQRLTLALALENAALLPMYLTFGPGGFATATTAWKALVGLKFVLGVSQLGIWLSKSSRPGSLLKDISGGVGDVLTVPSNLLSALYSVLAIGLAGAAVVFYQAPAAAAGWAGAFVPKLAAAHALAAAAFLYTLKNGADRNVLGRGTFKQINEAVAVAAAILGGVLYSAIKAGTIASTNTTTGLLAVAGITAATCLYEGVAAVVNKGKGGSVANDRGNYQYEKEDPLEAYCKNDPNAEECRVFDD